MIDSFCMLSEEDKKDVQDNIENYSLEEIEGKLSIICVRNKLDMSDKQNSKESIDTTFSLNALEENDDNIGAPAWVSELRKTKKTEI